MKLEETIQYLFDEYPGIYGHRWQALDQLYCTNGNGYDWVNGELVACNEENEGRKGYIAQLGEDGKATLHEEKVKARIEKYFEEFQNEYKENKAKLLAAGISEELAEEAFPTDGILARKMAERLSTIRKDAEIQFYPLSNYSALFTMPADVKPDWLEGAKETIALVKEHGHGFGGKKEEWNDWQREEHRIWSEKLDELALKFDVVLPNK